MYRHELSLPTCVHGLYSARKSKHCPWAKSEICNFVQFSTHFSWVWKVSWPLHFTDMASLVFEQDDKEEELLAQALYVDEDRLDVDEDDQRPPASGEEYLKKVVRESKKFKFVETGNFCCFFVPKDFWDFFHFLAENADELLGKVPEKATHVDRLKAEVGQDYLPSKEWQDIQVKNFTDVRLKLARHIALLKQSESDSKPTKFPSSKNEGGWCTLCFGSEFWQKMLLGNSS